MNDRAVLLGPGPSFVANQIPRLERLGKLFTVNRALRHWVHRTELPEGAFFMHETEAFAPERAVWEQAALRKYVGQEWGSWDKVPNVHRLKFVPVSAAKLPEASPWDFTELIPPETVICAAYQFLARTLGFRTVFIIGCECHLGNGLYGFDYPPLSDDRRRDRAHSFRVSCAAILRWALLASQRGIETINLSEISCLGLGLETLDVEEAVQRFNPD